MNRPTIQSSGAAREFASKRTRSMTLVEILVAMTIGVSMIGLAMVASVELYKNLSAAETYTLMHEEARQAMMTVSRDIRCSISNTANNSTHLTLRSVALTGATNTVQYLLQTNATTAGINNLIRVENSTTNTLTDHATAVLFEYWNSPGAPATNAPDTSEIRVSLIISNTGVFRLTTDLLQTRARMRNRHY